MGIADIVKDHVASSGSSSGGSSSSSSSVSGGSGGSSGSRTSATSIFERENQYSSVSDCINAMKQNELFGARIVDASSRIQNDILNNDEWKVDMDLDGDGVAEDGVKLAEAIAASCDSELDLYIQDALEKVMKEHGVNLRDLFGTKNSVGIKELAKLGIKVDAVGDDSNWQNRTYAFSLVEIPDDIKAQGEDAVLTAMYGDPENGIEPMDLKVLEDVNGKKGSFIFADCLVPDGNAQGAEINLSSILDSMGYECLSKADFMDNPQEYYDLLADVQAGLDAGEYGASEHNINNLYNKTLNISTAVRAVYTANGNAPGQWGKAITYEQNLERIAKCGLGSTGNINGGTSLYNSKPSLGDDGYYYIGDQKIVDENGNAFKAGDEDALEAYIAETNKKEAEKAEAEQKEAAELQEKLEDRTSEIYNEAVTQYKKEHGVSSLTKSVKHDIKQEAEKQAKEELNI